MNTYDYDAISTSDGEIYCLECIPANLDDDDIMPVFAGSESERPLVCDGCGAIHDYMTIIGEDDSEAITIPRYVPTRSR